jgi:hypothetical protein
MPIDDNTAQFILSRLDEISRKVDLALAAATQSKDASIATEVAAHASADAAQKSMLAFDSLSKRVEILRKEHIANHGPSQVPVTLRTKKRNPG